MAPRLLCSIGNLTASIWICNYDVDSASLTIAKGWIMSGGKASNTVLTKPPDALDGLDVFAVLLRDMNHAVEIRVGSVSGQLAPGS